MLNERIKQLRQAQRLNQVELAAKLSVTKQTVSNWENNNIQPSVDVLERLADLFVVTTDYLLGREEIPRIGVEGLSDMVIQHLRLVILDLQKQEK